MNAGYRFLRRLRSALVEPTPPEGARPAPVHADVDRQLASLTAALNDISSHLTSNAEQIEFVSQKNDHQTISVEGTIDHVRQLMAERQIVHQRLDDLVTGLGNVSSVYGQRINGLSETVASLVREFSSYVPRALYEAEVGRLERLVDDLYPAGARLAAVVAERRSRQPAAGPDTSDLAALADARAEDIASLTLSVRKDLQSVVASAATGEEDARAALDGFAENFARFAIERDILLNNRDVYLRQIQTLSRPGGIPGDADRIHGPRPAFPDGILRADAPFQIRVVDIGAQQLDNEDDVFAPMRRIGAASIVGFEPLRDMADFEQRPGANLTLLNHFVGDGQPGEFRVNAFDPTSSLLEPDVSFLRQFTSLAEMHRVVKRIAVETKRLDDMSEISDCDYLKIDVQGGEMAVIDGGVRLLESTICIHCEVEFSPMYVEQPLFSDIDAKLRGLGFELIDLIDAGYNGYADLDRPIARSRLLWADAIYFKSRERLAAVSPDKLLRAAFIAHVNYGMYDLAAHYLAQYDAVTDQRTNEAYAAGLGAAAL